MRPEESERDVKLSEEGVEDAPGGGGSLAAGDGGAEDERGESGESEGGGEFHDAEKRG